MMIKAIFFDVDGTLLSHSSKSVPQGTRDALALLRHRGIKTVVATGRHMSALARLPGNDIPFDGYITLNGQICLDADRRLLSGSPIGKEAVGMLVREFEKGEVPIMLVEKSGMYINFIDDAVRLAHKAISTVLPEIGVYSGEPIYQAIVYLNKGEEEGFYRGLPGCTFTRWCDYGIDIISDTGGKVSGIKRYLKENGIRREEIAAFGDGENDIEMLRFAGVGIAMGNADTAVQKAADHVTASVDDDGIAKALKYLGIC